MSKMQLWNPESTATLLLGKGARMTYVGILEDDALQREALQSMVESHYEAQGENHEAVAFAGAGELVSYLGARRPLDILLADIVLDGEGAEKSPSSDTAIDLIRGFPLLGGDVQVIYVTGYEKYHTSAYETDHACFLLKPVSQADLDFALARAEGLRRKRCIAPFRIRAGSEDRIVRPAQISFVESDRRILKINVAGSSFETYGKLSDYERRLPERFVRCHKSFLVNMDYVVMCRANELALSTGEKIPVSQSRRKQTQEAVRAYVRDMR